MSTEVDDKVQQGQGNDPVDDLFTDVDGLTPDEEFQRLQSEATKDPIAGDAFRRKVEERKAQQAASATSATPATEEQPATKHDIADAIKNLATTLVTPQQQPQQTPPPPQITPEEFYKKIGRWEPNEELLNKMLTSDDPAERLAAWTAMRDAQVQTSANLAMLASQQAVAQVMQQIAPMMQSVQEVQQQRDRDNFFGTYPALKEHADLLDTLSDQYRAQGVQFKSKEEAFTRLAGDAEKLIKKFNPNFAVKPQQQQQQPKPTPAGGQMSRTSTGGGGGGVSGSAQSTRSQKNEVAEAFGD